MADGEPHEFNAHKFSYTIVSNVLATLMSAVIIAASALLFVGHQKLNEAQAIHKAELGALRSITANQIALIRAEINTAAQVLAEFRSQERIKAAVKTVEEEQKKDNLTAAPLYRARAALQLLLPEPFITATPTSTVLGGTTSQEQDQDQEQAKIDEWAEKRMLETIRNAQEQVQQQQQQVQQKILQQIQQQQQQIQQ
jgi:hypothetical protein